MDTSMRSQPTFVRSGARLLLIFGLFLQLELITATNKYSTYEHHGHQHGGHGFGKEAVHDREHLKEDLKERYGGMEVDVSSDDEMDYHYFNMHDFDRSGSLDGLEMLYAMNHVIDDPEALLKDPSATTSSTTTTMAPVNVEDPHEYYEHLRRQQKWNKKFDEDAEIVDGLLKEYDRDGDGFISWIEFKFARDQDK